MRPASVLINSILSGCSALALASADFSVSPTGNATRPGEGPNLAGNERRGVTAISTTAPEWNDRAVLRVVAK
jgi:hypothetical protein